jgi:hypothetical protein
LGRFFKSFKAAWSEKLNLILKLQDASKEDNCKEGGKSSQAISQCFTKGSREQNP